MKKPTIYRTRGGVLVTLKGRYKERYRNQQQRRWKVGAYNAKTGGFHGWLWMHLLEVAS